jgi:hypothetical protein
LRLGPVATPHSDLLPGASAAQISTEPARIESSTTFSTSPRHPHLLRSLLMRTPGGDTAWLKGSVLAVEVIGRDPAGFDPQRDTTMRVVARRLRLRLSQCYEREGRDSALAIRMYTVRQVPRFELCLQGAANPSGSDTD